MTASLWDWRRRVADLYATIRADPAPEHAWQNWRRVRDGLFRDHAQTPIEGAFTALDFFPYDRALRFHVTLDPLEGPEESFPAGADGELRMRPFAKSRGLREALGGELTFYWLLGYGGGTFLPFADATSGRETYGAGRYLLDTIKSADLGAAADGRTVLDFNFAYNPSCAYSSRYVCPLAPAANRLPAAIRAGERTPA
ncbi:MAG: DUF1684 domain-containing protein [Gemmatimonadaceae bacterium]|nr:DUF1684 domain-containing protein [Acetobacteraceae bacterium]